jgi:hypothetical protein
MLERPHECPHELANVHMVYGVHSNVMNNHPRYSHLANPTLSDTSGHSIAPDGCPWQISLITWAQGVGRSNRPAPTNGINLAREARQSGDSQRHCDRAGVASITLLGGTMLATVINVVNRAPACTR